MEQSLTFRRGTEADDAFVWRGANAFTGLGQLRYQVSGSDVIVYGNNTGGLAADFAIVVADTASLVQSDFIL